jgi:superoxide reductase
MLVLKQVYRCSICGNVVEAVYAGAGELVCCGQPMQLLQENAVDASHEKHVPVLEGNDTSVTVKVGSAPHPMLEEHYIAFIELITTDNMILRQELKPGAEPMAVFPVGLGKVAYVREYCTLHGLWKNI